MQIFKKSVVIPDASSGVAEYNEKTAKDLKNKISNQNKIFLKNVPQSTSDKQIRLDTEKREGTKNGEFFDVSLKDSQIMKNKINNILEVTTSFVETLKEAAKDRNYENDEDDRLKKSDVGQNFSASELVPSSSAIYYFNKTNGRI